MQNVQIISIDTLRLQSMMIPIQFLEEMVFLPAWMDLNTSTVFMAMEDIAPQLRVDFHLVQRSEWLALNWIPSSMITCVQNVG
jgi:hypothetical protein